MIQKLIEPKTWESEFFERKIFSLNYLSDVGNNEYINQLNELDFDLVEANLNATDIKGSLFLETAGFRLIDSRITFVTIIDSDQKEYFFESPEEFSLRMYEEEDMEHIVKMTHDHLTYNPKFISRYKNIRYFSKDDSKKYFEQWIKYSLSNINSKTVVALFENKVIGFFMIQRKKDLSDNLPSLKGILTAVEPPYRGKNLHLSMQSHLFKYFDFKSFYLDNTTQLSNLAVIKNHIKSSRNLDKIELTFMLAREDFDRQKVLLKKDS